MTVAYQHVESDGCLSFCAPDGSDITVGPDAKFKTSDPAVIAYLDASPFVTRVVAEKAAAKPKAGD